MTPEEATVNLNAINALAGDAPNYAPWLLSFSYGRALQQPVLHAWEGDAKNEKLAQDALHKRAKLNADAVYGRYTQDMERAA